MLLQILEQSLLFFPLAIGVYLSYAILRTTDLTVDGSFVLGAAVFARLVSSGVHPVLSLLAAMLAGTAAGVGVSLIQLRQRINPLIASILAVFILSSVNFIILQRPNISLLRVPTIFNILPKSASLLIIAPMSLTLAAGVVFLLNSRTGLALRALGENPLLLRMMGKSSEKYKALGLAVSNSMAAFCGAMIAQNNGYADINMGFGMAIIGIGTVAIGEQLRRSFNSSLSPLASTRLIFCFTAVFIYFFALHSLIQYGIDPLYLKMVIGFLLIGCLAATRSKEHSHA